MPLKAIYHDQKRKFYKHQIDIRAVQDLSPLISSYIPWTGSSLRPSAAKLMLNEILINSRKSILELGSGISTVLLESFCRSMADIKIYSVDHNHNWQKIVQSMIVKNNGNPKNIIWITTPEKEYKDHLYQVKWYDEEKIKIQLTDKIDFLLVDGPVSTAKSRYVRYPALPTLIDQMNSTFAVMLDDTQRKAEKEIIEIWLKQFSLQKKDTTSTTDATLLYKTDKKLFNVI